MPISAAMFRSERRNPVPQCPPRLDVQMLTPVIWSRMPNHFLSPETGRVSERLGWMVDCSEPLTMMALHIPEENRYDVLMLVHLLGLLLGRLFKDFRNIKSYNNNNIVLN